MERAATQRVRRIRRRSAIMLVMLALGLIAGGIFRNARNSFGGELRVAQRQAEQLVVRPATGRAPGGAVAASGEDLAFLDPETGATWILPHTPYHAALLPFALQLRGVEEMADAGREDWLMARSASGEQRLALAPGRPVEAGEHAVTLVEARPWRGLLPRPSGAPMAELSVATGGGEEPGLFLLSTGEAQRVGREVACLFQWCDSEEAARAALAAPVHPWDAARWGVSDGAVTQWLTAFEPGARVWLQGGAEVELRAVSWEPEAPRLEVGISRNGGLQIEQVSANAYDRSALIQFDCPALAPVFVMLHAWREEEALARIFARGEEIQTAELGIGKPAVVEGQGLWLRLDRVARAALAVPEPQQNVAEAVLQWDDRLLRLREGEPRIVGDVTLTYTPQRPASARTFEFTAYDDRGEAIDSFRMRPGDSHTLGGWRLTLQDATGGAPPYVARIYASRQGSNTLIFAGAAAGIFGLALYVSGRTCAAAATPSAMPSAISPRR